MRPLHAAAAVLTILVMGAAIVAGGRAVLHDESVRVAARAQAGMAAQSEAPATSAIPRPKVARPEAHSRAIDPEVIAPPQLQSEELERVEPRAPLSELALAGPPKPPKTKMPDDWNGTKLFQPVAPAAGVIEAKGYSVAISGIDIVRQDETCTDGGKPWTCGTRARTAFRAFLRGRAVVCTVPPEGGRDLVAAECRVGNQDVGQWLIENGWARATKNGPYAEAGDKARTARKGIFGPAPSLSGLPPALAPVAAASQPTQPILDPSATATPPTETTATPPTDQPTPSE
ncbi:thermonuclease family protein [Mesorhizobium sp. M6A.T.Ce.TU.002.03.1.1]|uniref:thermonuclease family protein n=1 Tax=unclassified Mesorhizobium TaxID=325217 RepID=UPI000FCA525E|nr:MULTISPECIES: thermonuclease family protein [unclassified Mesorhizobium]RUU47292.1 thermonuclease family protein [Mesorhizobium sp. M6A.T.Ce.TU.002.03.1.1]RUU99127.1 thermonuclease family protein [Mesorhizobium sp. M6A.T.Cr.TU.017.01.1.1]RWO95943.1 MAG: thermonuclease family protein [Mesorhizobium sp.]TIM52328.1 MAG: thermonuclease family protein [Mesorhizobium sp.]